MRSTLPRAAALAGLAMVLLLTSCEYSTSPGTVTLRFTHSADGQALAEDQLVYTSPADYEYSVDLFEYLITDVRLWRADGTYATIASAHYGNAFQEIDRLVATAPRGTFTALSFQWGVAEAENKTGNLDTAFDGMLWPPPMGGGYHCMRLEGDYTVDTPGDKSYALHMGRTAPVANPGTVTNASVRITLDDVDLAIGDGGRWEIVVDIDVNNFMDDPLFDFEAESDVPDGGGGFMTLAFPTMPSHMAQGLLRDNTGNVFSVVSVERR